MDLKSLERDFGMLTLERRAKLAVSAGELAVDQLIQAEADAVGERNERIRQGFAEIFAIAGFTESATSIRRTPHIAVSFVDNLERGRGTLAVGLTAYLSRGRPPYDLVDTMVFFHPEGGGEAELLDDACEHYSSRIGSGTDFARRLREESREGRLNRTDPVLMMQEAWRNDRPKIEAAEETIAVLEEAIVNSVLNPAFRERVVAWEQTRSTEPTQA